METEPVESLKKNIDWLQAKILVLSKGNLTKFDYAILIRERIKLENFEIALKNLMDKHNDRNQFAAL